MEELLSRPNVGIEEIIKHPDIQFEYRTKNKKVLKIIMEEKSLIFLIDTFQNSLDKVILKRILGLFISPNTMIISEIGQNFKLTTKFLSVLKNPTTYHRFILSSICNVFIRIIDLQRQQVFKNIYSSNELLYLIMQTLHFPAVFQLAAKIILCGDSAISFGWLLLKTLLDEHGLGCSLPMKSAKLPVFNSKVPEASNKLYREQRIRAIELLILLFTQQFLQSFELFSATSNALPLLLQDAGDDRERSVVFRVGLSLRPSAALGYSAVSIVNSLACSDELLVAALQYITRFGVLVGPRSIELFVYRILHRKTANNFVMLCTASMVAKCVKLQNRNIELQSNLRDLLFRCFKVDGLSLLIRSFKGILIEAAKGEEIDPLSRHGMEKVKEARTLDEPINAEIEDRIREYRAKARAIDEGRSSIAPIFDAMTLWREDAKKIASSFDKVEKLNISIPLPQFSSLNSPSSKCSRRRVSGQKADVSLSEEEEFFLEEIDVTEKYQQIEFREVTDQKSTPQKELPPLTTQEAIKEPIPSSPVLIEDTLISKLTRVISPRPSKEPAPLGGNDDITLDVPPRPPKIVLPDSESDDENDVGEMKSIILRQLETINRAKKCRAKLVISRPVSNECE